MSSPQFTHIRFLAAALVGFALLWPITPSHAFDSSVMASVVSVLPKWPQSAGEEGRPKDPEGSGVAIFAGGYIATADHVIGRATEIDVRLNNGQRLSADVIGRDPASDVALLKVDMDIPVPSMDANPSLGTPVCAIGNPFGLGLSVSCGVVSGVHLTGTGFNPFEDFVQTDAALNPGSSGGGLFTISGSLVGMNSAIFSNSGDGNIGVNFATSIGMVLRVTEDLRDFGRVRRIQSGMVVAALDEELERMHTGVRVRRVNAGSPAEVAGLFVNDIVTAIDGRAIFKPSDATAAIFLRKPDSILTVSILRNNRTQNISLTLSR